MKSMDRDRPRQTTGRRDRRKVSRRARPLRPVRRPLRARDAVRRLREARSRHEAASARGGIPGRAHARAASWVGRPTALTHAPKLSKAWGAEVWLKREDLAHTGAHKINNALGQAMLAKRLGAQRVVAETGAGQHGVASAAACARIGLPCTVYMGAVDMERQAPNVGRMKLLGATVVPVTNGDQTLRAAIDEAFRDWVEQSERHLLHHRLRRGPASVSLPGARAADRDRQGGARADAGAVGRPARRRDLLRGRRLECHRHVPSVPRRQVGRDHRHRSRRHGQGARPQRRDARVRPARRAAGRVLAAAAGCRRPDPGNRIGFRRPRLSRRRPRAFAAAVGGPRALRSRHRRRIARGADRVLPHRRHPARDRIGACFRRREALGAASIPARKC